MLSSFRRAILTAVAIASVGASALLPFPAGADELVVGLGDRFSALLPTVVNIETITLTPAAAPGIAPRRGTLLDRVLSQTPVGSS